MAHHSKFWLMSLAFLASAHAATQELPKLKHGDRLQVAYTVYAAQGTAVVVERSQILNALLSVQGSSYSLASELQTSVYNRDTHTAIERVVAGSGRMPIPVNEQLTWFPPGGDFSQLKGGRVALLNQRCGEGQFNYEAKAKPVKISLQIAGKPQELSAQEVSLDGRWSYAHCGVGQQTLRYVYAPQIDAVVERDLKTFLPNGTLSSGNNRKLLQIN